MALRNPESVQPIDPVGPPMTRPEAPPFERVERGASGPTPEEIAAEAYSRYAARSYEDGHDVDDWLAAEEWLRGRSDTTH